MADVFGPVSTLPGKAHTLPENSMCDMHPDRKAVIRIQGETDSFGCEVNDLCKECLEEHVSYELENKQGICDWCNTIQPDLRPSRDYEEGLYGPVYRICGACNTKRNQQIQSEMDSYYWDD